MEHVTTRRFWVCYGKLPPSVRALADKNYALLKVDPRHPSLHFKKVGEYWSVRVDSPSGLAWFWIGPHDEYKLLIRS